MPLTLRKFFAFAAAACVVAGLAFIPALAAGGDWPAQIPTVSVPTVTGTPSGPMAVVRNTGDPQGQVELYAGPSFVSYNSVGVLVVGQQAPALGRSAGDDWVQIAYPGSPNGIAWVYGQFVEVDGSLPVVEPPPTPTAMVTPTLDPTLAARFQVNLEPTRLPTYTAPPPVIPPTEIPNDAGPAAGRVPMGLLIIGMSVVGMFGALISLLRGR